MFFFLQTQNAFDLSLCFLFCTLLPSCTALKLEKKKTNDQKKKQKDIKKRQSARISAQLLVCITFDVIFSKSICSNSLKILTA